MNSNWSFRQLFPSLERLWDGRAGGKMRSEAFLENSKKNLGHCPSGTVIAFLEVWKRFGQKCRLSSCSFKPSAVEQIIPRCQICFWHILQKDESWFKLCLDNCLAAGYILQRWQLNPNYFLHPWAWNLTQVSISLHTTYCKSNTYYKLCVSNTSDWYKNLHPSFAFHKSLSASKTI